jgi:hypothetical protein
VDGPNLADLKALGLFGAISRHDIGRIIAPRERQYSSLLEARHFLPFLFVSKLCVQVLYFGLDILQTNRVMKTVMVLRDDCLFFLLKLSKVCQFVF